MVFHLKWFFLPLDMCMYIPAHGSCNTRYKAKTWRRRESKVDFCSVKFPKEADIWGRIQVPDHITFAPLDPRGIGDTRRRAGRHDGKPLGHPSPPEDRGPQGRLNRAHRKSRCHGNYSWCWAYPEADENLLSVLFLPGILERWRRELAASFTAREGQMPGEGRPPPWATRGLLYSQGPGVLAPQPGGCKLLSPGFNLPTGFV